MTTKARELAKLVDDSGNVDVTGTVTADGLTVENTSVIAGSFDGGSAATYVRWSDATDNWFIGTNNGLGGMLFKNETADANRFFIGANGDVSFYEDTGTTAKMVWDASAEKLSIDSNSAFPLTLDSDSGETILKIDNSSTNGRRYWLISGGSAGSFAGGKFGVYDADSLSVPFLIDSSGNVGVGTSAPSRSLHVNSGSSNECAIFESTDTEVTLALKDSTGTSEIKCRNDFRFNSGGSERARIDSSGSLLVGTTSGNFAARFVVENSASYTFLSRRTGTGSEGHVVFQNANGAVGTIFTNGSTTSYNTSSDYRLKENVTFMDNASDRVLALNPCRFNFITDPDTTVDGFLAHEAQEVVPEAVHGTKDAMKTEEYEVSPAVEATYDEDGNELTPEVEAVMGTREVPDYQGIDQSKLVPLLTKALQEALTRIEALENANGNS